MAGGPAYLGGKKPKSQRGLWIGLLATVVVTLMVFAGLWLLPHLVCSGSSGQTPGCLVPPSR
jgi:hypothetical protein